LRVGQCLDFMKPPAGLPFGYMQNLHNLMPGSGVVLPGRAPSKKAGTLTGSGLFADGKGFQAMNTAMKASRKISTAPATGNTMGIRGTTDSTTSWGWSLWSSCAGWDMGGSGKDQTNQPRF
jgi:hypothetical protein